MGLRALFVVLLSLSLPSTAQPSEPVRGLLRVLSSEKAQTTELVANTGWQPLYLQTVEVKAGDLLRLVGGAQLTLDAAPVIGQQVRLTVNGESVGSQLAEINTQPGAHHLPMAATGLYQASQDGSVVVALEGSAFHSDGNFPLTVDHQGELATGSLLVEQYRSYPDLQTLWDAGALLLNDVHHPAARTEPVWGLTPYLQQQLAEVSLPVNAEDILRTSAQAVAFPSFGLEQFTGVLTAGEVAISPYGGQNVLAPENPMAPMWIEGYTRAKADGKLLLQHRLYGAFGNGLTLLPDTARFEVAHFASYGRALEKFSQSRLERDEFLADGSSVDVWTEELTLAEDDILRVTATLQLGPPALAAPVDCRLIVEIEGPSGVEQSMSGKSLSAVRSMVPMSSFVSVHARASGTYRVRVKLNGISPFGPLGVKLNAAHSQVQLLHYSMPAGEEPSLPGADESP